MSDRDDARDLGEVASSDALDAAMSIAFGSQPRDEAPSFDETSAVVGRYKLLEQIGEGGFGVVYMAEQREPISRRVALKIIKLGMDTKQVVARFEAERQALAMMQHENIASVFDAGATETGRPYFVLELVRGVTITEYCDRNKLGIRERLKLFISVCNAVQHAHQKGIIHRDLKPSNVMVTLRDGVPIPKVIDFGVAKATQTRLTEKTVFTRYGQFMGTPAYMSPEQVEMTEVDVDTRSDIYSLGVLLYELLTGGTPIENERLRRASYSELQRIICEQQPPRPSSRLSHSGESLAFISAQRASEPNKLGHLLRGELDWIVMKALEKDRARRYETASGFAEDVRRYLNDEPVTATPPSAGYALRKFASKHRKLIAVATAFAAVLLTGTVVSTWLAIRATQAEDRAVHNEGLAGHRLLQETLARREMKKQRDRAEGLAEEAKEAAERSRNLLYVAHMNLIQRELTTGNDPRIVTLLDLHKPSDDGRDRRGFEWYYAWALCNRNPWTWRHHASVTSVALGPAGKVAATGCSDGRLQVWDRESGQIVAAVNGHASVISDIAFAPDGNAIASGSFDNTARLWTFHSGRLNPAGAVLQCDGAVRRVAFSPDGTQLAVGSSVAAAGSLKLWNLASDVHRDVDGETQGVVSLAFSRDGTMLASGGMHPTVSIVDAKTAKVAKTVEIGLSSVIAMAYSPADDTLALGDDGGTIVLWAEATGRRRIGQHASSISDVAFSTNGQLLASSGRDHLIKLWDIKRADTADVLRGHSSVVNALAFSRDDETLVSASEDHTVKLWDLARGQASIHLAAHEAPVAALAFSPTDRKMLASGSADGSLKLWNLDESRPAATLPAYGGTVRCVAISPGGETIAYAGGPEDRPADVLFWNRESKTIRRTVKEHSRAVLSVAFSPDGRTLASGGDDGLLNLWDVATGTLKATLENNTQAIVSAAWSPDGKWLATSSFYQNAITIWNVAKGNERRTLAGHGEWVTSVAFSPDGVLLASGSVDNTVRIWDVAAGTERFALAGHSGRVVSVAFSPDGMTLASIGRDNRLRLWDAATGQEKANLDCRPTMNEGLAVAFSLDGRSLAAASGNSIVVHRAATDQDFFSQETPEVPRNHRPTPDAAVSASAVQLEAAPFVHRHSGVSHSSSHWQVRAAEGGYTVPVVDQMSTQSLTALRLDRGILLPNTMYFWRVAFTGSNHKETSFSGETSFVTRDFSMTAVPFDLTPHFNRDIVRNPDDEETDSFDASPGSHLVVDGFDGTRSDNARCNGLPKDRRVGLHILGDYSGNNAIQTGLTDGDASPIRVSVPHGRYDVVRFVVVGGNGNSDMPVRFEYEDGTTQREIVRCDDWFHDLAQNRYGLLRKGLLPIINEMDRFYENEFRDENAAAAFEVIVEVDSSRKLLAFELETDAEDVHYTDTALWPDHRRVRFNLLAATGVLLAATGVAVSP